MNQIEYLDDFEEKLLIKLLELCTSRKMLGGELLASEDIDLKWKEIAPEYMADSVRELNDYPSVAIAWAAYVGMAIAELWDRDWSAGQALPYSQLHGKQGFDDMDENILTTVLGIELGSAEATEIEDTLRSCATLAISLIRREEIEAQTTSAFYVFSRTARVMFRIGASIRLHQLGYKFEKVQTDELLN